MIVRISFLERFFKCHPQPKIPELSQQRSVIFVQFCVLTHKQTWGRYLCWHQSQLKIPAMKTHLKPYAESPEMLNRFFNVITFSSSVAVLLLLPPRVKLTYAVQKKLTMCRNGMLTWIGMLN